MCTDYQSLNNYTVSHFWLLPCIDEMLAWLKEAHFFSKLDLREGYHQIPVAEQDRFKTAFTCQYGMFERVIMPFGLKNASLHFRRSMNLLLADLLDKCVLFYMDDILIYSEMDGDHVVHVKAVFECLVAKNWHIKEQKCALFLPEVEFLGHMVSAEGAKVAVDKVDAVSSWLTPICVREVQGFLGLGKFYRRFV